MFKTSVIALLIVTVSCCYAELPLVELIDPRSPSKDVEGVLTTKDGRKVEAHLRTFGSDQIERAESFGKSVAADPSRDRLVREKAFELYPNDPFFRRAFVQYAAAK